MQIKFEKAKAKRKCHRCRKPILKDKWCINSKGGRPPMLVSANVCFSCVVDFVWLVSGRRKKPDENK